MDKISAFMDGESSRMETRQIMSRLKQSGECCEIWETFHLIGDVMRGEHPALHDDFRARIHASIESEPTRIAPRIILRRPMQLLVSAVASCAAVALVIALVYTDNPLNPGTNYAAVPKPDPVQVAGNAAPQPVSAANQVRVNEYLMAHQEYSPSTTLHGVATYVRTVSASQDGR